MSELKIELNETLILKSLAKGDQASFDKLFRKYYKYLVSIAYTYVKDENAAKDMVQDVYLDLWNRRTTLNINQSIKYYLRRAVINTCLAAKRKTDRLEINSEKIDLNPGSVETTKNTVAYNELNNSVETIINTLPERCREIYILSRTRNLSHKEIATKLNISTKTIENQMTKALKTLRTELKKKGLLIIFGIILIQL